MVSRLKFLGLLRYTVLKSDNKALTVYKNLFFVTLYLKCSEFMYYLSYTLNVCEMSSFNDLSSVV